MDDVKSPILKSAIESFVHGVEHFIKNTSKDRKFAILHIDQAVELILKETLISKGKTIYKGNKTLNLHETFNSLDREGIKILERPIIEDAHEIRNMAQHRGHTVTKETITYYVKIEYDFVKNFLKSQMDIDISDHIRKEIKISFERYSHYSPKKQMKSAYDQINNNPTGSILSIFGELEYILYQNFPNDNINSITSKLIRSNLINESENKEFSKAYNLKRKITDELHDPSIEEAKKSFEIVSKIIKIISNSNENKPIILKDFPKMIEKYIKAKKLESSTVKTYKDILYKFYTFLTVEKDVSNVKKLVIAFKKYINYQKNEKSENTVNLITNVIKKFLEFYNVDTNHIKTPKRTKTNYEILTEQEIESLINTFDKSNGRLSKNTKVRTLRDKLLLTLIYSSKLKVSEIRFLIIANIDFNEKKIKLTDKNDYIPFNNDVKILIEEYLQERSDKNKFLFINKSGNPLSTRGIEIIIKRHGEIAGIEKKVNPTILKRSFKAHLLEKGTDIISIGGINDRQSSLDII